MREINEVEEVLADISKVIGCTCIIDPSETLGDRVRHLGTMTILLQASLGQLRKFQGAKLAHATLDDMDYREMLRRVTEN